MNAGEDHVTKNSRSLDVLDPVPVSTQVEQDPAITVATDAAAVDALVDPATAEDHKLALAEGDEEPLPSTDRFAHLTGVRDDEFSRMLIHQVFDAVSMGAGSEE